MKIPAYNYGFRWNAESNIMLLVNVHENAVNFNERVLAYKQRYTTLTGYQLKTPAQRVTFSLDSVVNNYNSRGQLLSTDEVHLKEPHRPASGKTIQFSRTQFDEALVHEIPRTFSGDLILSDLHLDSIGITLANDLYLAIDSNSNCKAVEIDQSQHIEHRPDGAPNQLPYFNLTVIPGKSDIPKTVNLSHVRLRNIATGKSFYVVLESCEIADTSSVACSDVGAIAFYHTNFLKETAKIRLRSTNINGSIWDKDRLDTVEHKTELIMDGYYAGHLELDYQYFHYSGSKKRSESENNYRAIIKYQKAKGFDKGYITASIDSCAYEDTQNIFEAPFVPVKKWWNNYGYEKPKVFSSILLLFAFIWLINILCFKTLRATYAYVEVDKALMLYRSAYKRLTPLKKTCYLIRFCINRLFLTCMFTCYLFFGLKLEFEKIVLSNPKTATWIFTQYVTGIISLAYIANLIITK